MRAAGGVLQRSGSRAEDVREDGGSARDGVRPLLSDTGGGGGQIGPPGFWLTHPPTHPPTSENFCSGKK